MAKKTSSKSVKASSKATTKPEPQAQTKKAVADTAKAEARPQKERAKKQAPEVTPNAEAKKASEKVESKATTPRPRDQRLPAPGTVLQKKDRQGGVRCECTVEEEGVRYNGTVYRSLSAAAMAASKDMGNGGRAQNGFLFWGLIKQPARASDPVAALERAWERYRERATGAVAGAKGDDEARARIKDAITRQADALVEITQAL